MTKDQDVRYNAKGSKDLDKAVKGTTQESKVSDEEWKRWMKHYIR